MSSGDLSVMTKYIAIEKHYYYSKIESFIFVYLYYEMLSSYVYFPGKSKGLCCLVRDHLLRKKQQFTRTTLSDVKMVLYIKPLYNTLCLILGGLRYHFYHTCGLGIQNHKQKYVTNNKTQSKTLKSRSKSNGYHMQLEGKIMT